ncbi:hypothetical protein ABEW68_15250 [Paenibacillus lautus]|uniref:hypothetical protein n=1 Tax=Paenibacillus lautus TaxID=1401 RepID=UPI003D2D0A4D
MKIQSVVSRNVALPFFQGEKWLVYTGLLGFLLAGLCAYWVMLYGGPVAPYGDVSKAFSFNAALGIFLLSTAAILPFSGLGTKRKAFLRWSYIALSLFAYVAETMQNFRGMNPRFVKDGTPFDVAIGSIFTVVALLFILYYVFIAIAFFRKQAYSLQPKLVLGIRYAMIAVMLSFAAGIWISIEGIIGKHGSMMWLHGLGFHALQVVPFVAWLSEQKRHVTAARHRFIHLTGITYLLGLVAIGWQTYLGRAVLEMSIFPILAACCFLIAFIPVVVLLLNKTEIRHTSEIQN